MLLQTQAKGGLSAMGMIRSTYAKGGMSGMVSPSLSSCSSSTRRPARNTRARTRTRSRPILLMLRSRPHNRNRNRNRDRDRNRPLPHSLTPTPPLTSLSLRDCRLLSCARCRDASCGSVRMGIRMTTSPSGCTGSDNGRCWGAQWWRPSSGRWVA